MSSTSTKQNPRRVRGLDFFRGFLRSPEQVGSLIPSSRFLEQRIVDAAALGGARRVVELGPGTGGTTRALLATMPADGQLLAIDLEPRFVRILDEEIDDPRLLTHAGSAADLPDILAAHGMDAADAVISGIPFSTMPREVGERIIRAVWDSLAPGGRFVAYQFRDRVAKLARPIIGHASGDLELRNAPPMRVYRWEKTS